MPISPYFSRLSTRVTRDAGATGRSLASRAKHLMILFGVVLAVSGCQLDEWVSNGLKVGPEYQPVPAAVAHDWIESEDERIVPIEADLRTWWAVFEDPALNDLVQTAYSQNLSLREAGWRVSQARAQRDIAAGNLFPQSQQVYGQYDRLQNSEKLATPVPLRSFDQWATGLTVAWEMDVWGRFRRSVDSADANLEAVIGDYDAILVCLIAEVAAAYTELRTAQLRLEYAKQNIDLQRGSLQLAESKLGAGASSATGVYLARSSLETVRAGVPVLEIQRRQASNRLCTLLGIPPSDLAGLIGPGPIPDAPAQVAIGIPADLLRRRPDVRAAERAVAAQSEQIGIAVSDLYPHFTLAGDISFESEKFSHLVTSASNAGSIGPAFNWDVLNYGRLKNGVRLQEAGLEELVATYQNTVLTANQEVEDSIVSFLQSQERVKLLEGSVKETEEALRLLRISFEEGEISFTGIYVVQGQLVSLKDQLAQSKGDVVTSLIGIYKALGGGWEVRCAPQPTYDQWWLGQSGSRSPSLDAKMTRPTDTDVEKSDGEEAFVPPLPAPPVPDQESVPEQDVVPNQVPAKERGPEPADQVEE